MKKILIGFFVLLLWVFTPLAHAQNAGVHPVPFRLMSESKEQIEIKIVFTGDYKKVDHVEYDITVPKSDGAHEYALKSNEGAKVLLTYTVKSNKVQSTKINTDLKPTDATKPSTLSVSSGSGERVLFIFDWTAQGGVKSANISSDRIK